MRRATQQKTEVFFYRFLVRNGLIFPFLSHLHDTSGISKNVDNPVSVFRLHTEVGSENITARNSLLFRSENPELGGALYDKHW